MKYWWDNLGYDYCKRQYDLDIRNFYSQDHIWKMMRQDKILNFGTGAPPSLYAPLPCNTEKTNSMKQDEYIWSDELVQKFAQEQVDVSRFIRPTPADPILEFKKKYSPFCEFMTKDKYIAVSGDLLWIVDNNYKLRECNVRYTAESEGNCVAFKHKDNALKYIEANKPKEPKHPIGIRAFLSHMGIYIPHDMPDALSYQRWVDLCISGTPWDIYEVENSRGIFKIGDHVCDHGTITSLKIYDGNVYARLNCGGRATSAIALNDLYKSSVKTPYKTAIDILNNMQNKVAAQPSPEEKERLCVRIFRSLPSEINGRPKGDVLIDMYNKNIIDFEELKRVIKSIWS